MYRYLYMCMNYLDVGLNLKKVQHILIFQHVHKHTKNNNKSPTNPNVLGKLTLIAISMTLLTQNPHPYFVYLFFFFYFCLWFVYNKSLIKVEIVISFISVLSCEQSKLCRVGVANTIFVHLIKKKQWQLSTNCSIYELKHACISTNSTKSPQDLHPLFRQG